MLLLLCLCQFHQFHRFCSLSEIAQRKHVIATRAEIPPDGGILDYCGDCTTEIPPSGGIFVTVAIGTTEIPLSGGILNYCGNPYY